MKRVRREKPLHTLKEIFAQNGIKYDTSSPSSYIDVVDEDGNCLQIDASFNLFDNIEQYYSHGRDRLSQK